MLKKRIYYQITITLVNKKKMMMNNLMIKFNQNINNQQQIYLQQIKNKQVSNIYNMLKKRRSKEMKPKRVINPLMIRYQYKKIK